MRFHQSASSVDILAPAKLNLFLELKSRRDDGYHELENVMVSVSVFDTLRIQLTSADSISVVVRWFGPSSATMGEDGWKTRSGNSSEFPQGKGNLVWKALELLRTRAGKGEGLTVAIEKRIPSQAGMGGASSDAASSLVAANRLWGIGWSLEKLQEVAAEIGSDVPYFLMESANRCHSAQALSFPALSFPALSCPGAICRGRGELITPVILARKLWFVIVKPPVGLSTAAVYANCQVPRVQRSSTQLVGGLAAGRFSEIGRHYWNRLQQTASQMTPWVERCSELFRRLGCQFSQMSGSGTSYFGMFSSPTLARRAKARIRCECPELLAYICHTTNGGT